MLSTQASERQTGKYRQVRVLSPLLAEAEKLVKNGTYNSVPEFVNDALRRRLEDLKQKSRETA